MRASYAKIASPPPRPTQAASLATFAFLASALVAAGGCSSYKHERPTAQGIEVTSFRSFLMMGRANKVRTVVKDTDYSRTVSVGGIEGQGDSGMVTASGAAMGEAIGTAAQKMRSP